MFEALAFVHAMVSPVAEPASTAVPEVIPSASPASPGPWEPAGAAAQPSAGPPPSGAAPAPGGAAPGPAPAESPASQVQKEMSKGTEKARKRAPRSLGLWLGYGWSPVNYLPLRADGERVRPHGMTLALDYLWQVGGLQPGGWPAYVGFLLGFNYLPGVSGQRHALTIEYGIVVRHTLATHLKVYPYLGYGLGAVQALVFGAEGRGIGHLTRLSIGFEGRVRQRVRLAFEVNYKIDPIRAFGVDGKPGTKFDYHMLGALFGVNFNL